MRFICHFHLYELKPIRSATKNHKVSQQIPYLCVHAFYMTQYIEQLESQLPLVIIPTSMDHNFHGSFDVSLPECELSKELINFCLLKLELHENAKQDKCFFGLLKVL